MAKAMWNGEVIAESDKTILVEGNLYFPPESVKREYSRKSDTQYTCPWKGQAGYYDIMVKGKVYKDAAWYYYEPSEVAEAIRDYIAFERGVEVEGSAAGRLDRPF